MILIKKDKFAIKANSDENLVCVTTDYRHHNTEMLEFDDFLTAKNCFDTISCGERFDFDGYLNINKYLYANIKQIFARKKGV